jgi:predicted RNA binding protein YcfA (HicA-like mRNA interferase family)
MSQFDKILIKILSGTQDTNILFSDLCNVLEALGFSMRIKGSHHIFYRENIDEIINIQPVNSKAKPYQVKQIRNIILRYKLGGNNDV